MWNHPKGIASILSLKTLKNRHHVTYNSKERNSVFKVHTNHGVAEFMPLENRLHYLDLMEKEEAEVAHVTVI